MIWAWLSFYLVASVTAGQLWPKRVANGLSAKPLKKLVRHQRLRDSVRYYAWCCIAWLFIGYGTLWFWPVVIGFVVDDYVFGDDDKWKRGRDWVRNKIKWQMDLPAPASDQVAS